MDTKKFIEELSSRLDLSVNTVTMLIESLNKEFAETSSEMDGIIVPGFGSFEPKLREERVAVHPSTGKKLLVPPRIILSFRQSPVLKQIRGQL